MSCYSKRRSSTRPLSDHRPDAPAAAFRAPCLPRHLETPSVRCVKTVSVNITNITFKQHMLCDNSISFTRCISIYTVFFPLFLLLHIWNFMFDIVWLELAVVHSVSESPMIPGFPALHDCSIQLRLCKCSGHRQPGHALETIKPLPTTLTTRLGFLRIFESQRLPSGSKWPMVRQNRGKTPNAPHPYLSKADLRTLRLQQGILLSTSKFLHSGRADVVCLLIPKTNSQAACRNGVAAVAWHSWQRQLGFQLKNRKSCCQAKVSWTDMFAMILRLQCKPQINKMQQNGSKWRFFYRVSQEDAFRWSFSATETSSWLLHRLILVQPPCASWQMDVAKLLKVKTWQCGEGPMFLVSSTITKMTWSPERCWNIRTFGWAVPGEVSPPNLWHLDEADATWVDVIRCMSY